MFSFFRKNYIAPTATSLPVNTPQDLRIFPETIHTNVVGHDFCFDWQKVQDASEAMNCNLDHYLCAPLVERLLGKSLKSPVTFWYTPLGKLFVVTVYSPRKVDFFDPLVSMQGYVEYGGNYLRPNAMPFLHWDGKNAFRVHAIRERLNGMFLLADFGNGFGLDVSETDEHTYNEILNKSVEYFGYSAVPHVQRPNALESANLIRHVFVVSDWR